MAATRTLLRNGKRHAIALDEKTSFLEVVRGPLGIHSAARGCGNGLCGACRVLVEGEPCNACMMTLGEVPDGARIEGYEDVASEPAAELAVRAFVAERATRCSLCVPSIGVTAVALARHGKSGDAEAIDAALETAACMCTGRGSLRRALLASAHPRETREQKA
jgi:aerobic-type carbon monoxide dehydrogenase small subunit (CoxS/CutS family)